MSRSGGTEQQAFSQLKALSQQKDCKLAVVAQGIVDEAVRGAHARRASDT